MNNIEESLKDSNALGTKLLSIHKQFVSFESIHNSLNKINHNITDNMKLDLRNDGMNSLEFEKRVKKITKQVIE
jgi:hypothetical protein